MSSERLPEGIVYSDQINHLTPDQIKRLEELADSLEGQKRPQTIEILEIGKVRFEYGGNGQCHGYWEIEE